MELIVMSLVVEDYLWTSNYIEYLSKLNDTFNVTYLFIPDIDRGIDDFVEFANVLHYKFPKLEILHIHQNYSFYKDKDDDKLIDDFLYFIKILKLKKLYFFDHQTLLLHNKSLNDRLFTVMSENCVIYIGDGSDMIIKSNIFCKLQFTEEGIVNYGVFNSERQGKKIIIRRELDLYRRL